jgi:hypothetical protein
MSDKLAKKSFGPRVPLCDGLLALALFASACSTRSIEDVGASATGGGGSTTGGGPNDAGCSLPTAAFTSLEALALARCAASLPKTAVLGQVASDNDGQLNAIGRDVTWSLGYVDVLTNETIALTVSTKGIDVSPPAVDWPLGAVPSSADVDSTMIVPKGISEIAALDSMVGGSVNYFLMVGVDMDTGQLEWDVRMVRSLPSQDGGGEANVWWYAHFYGTPALFHDVCGPCKPASQPACCPAE